VTRKTVLTCVLDWRDRDDQVGWRDLTTRRLLADLVGGEVGNLRGAVRRLDRDLKRIES
jgi:hypothetical protein